MHSKFDVLKNKFHGAMEKMPKKSSSSEKGDDFSVKLQKALTPLYKAISKYLYEHEKMVGVDITPHYIRVCEMEYSYGKWSMKNLASACMENQFRKDDILNSQELYVENLKELLQKNNIKTTNAAFALPAHSSIIKIVNLPAMSEEDFREAANLGAIWENLVTLEGNISEYQVYYKILGRRKVKVEAQEEIIETIASQNNTSTSETLQTIDKTAPASNFGGDEAIKIEYPEGSDEPSADNPKTVLNAEGVPETAVITSEIVSENGDVPDLNVLEENEVMDILFVASKLSDIYIHSGILEGAGLKPLLADVRSLALVHAYSTDKESQKTTEPFVIMEFGYDDNYIMIADGVYSEKHDILLLDDDKELIIAKTPDKAALSAFIERFAEQAKEKIQMFESANQGKKILNVYVTSNAPLHVDNAETEPLMKLFLREVAKFMQGYQINGCKFCNHIEVPEKFAKKVNAEGDLSAWAVVIGQATRKMDVFAYNDNLKPYEMVNLLPESANYIKNTKFKISSAIASAGVGALMILIMMMLYTSLIAKRHNLATEISQMAGVESEFNTKSTEFQRLRVMASQIDSLKDIKSGLPSNQADILASMQNLTEVIPEGVWLTELNYVLPNTIEITGQSVADQNILTFVQKLNESEAFEEVTIKTMTALDKDKAQDTGPIVLSAPVKEFKLDGRIKASNIDKIDVLTKKDN